MHTRKKEKEHVRKVMKDSLDAVNEGLKKYPKSETLKLEKKQIERYMKAENNAIGKMNYRDMQKSKVKNGVLAVGGVLGMGGGVVSLATLSTFSTFSPLALVCPLGFMAGFGTGAVALASATRERIHSEEAKIMKNGEDWIAGAAKTVGAKTIAGIDRDLAVKRKTQAVSIAVANQHQKIANESFRQSNEWTRQVNYQNDQIFQQQMMTNLNIMRHYW